MLAIIKTAGKSGIAVYDLSEELKKEFNDSEVDKTLNQLLRMGKVRVMMGKSKSGTTCRVVQLIDDADESVRARIGKPDEKEESPSRLFDDDKSDE